MHADAHQAGAPSDGRGPAPQGARPLDIVVVDDHPMWRDTMAQVVERFSVGRVVAQAGDGVEALSVLGVTKPDVVVMDVDMPGMDGVEVTQRLRERGVEAKVLFLSSFDDRDKVLGAVTAGASGYLLKTSGAAAVAKAIRRIAEGELVFPPHLADVLLQAIRRDAAAADPAADRTTRTAAVAPPAPPPPPGASSRPRSAPARAASMHREGDLWSVSFCGRAAHLPDLKGLGYLAELIRARGREIMALDLMTQPSGSTAPAAAREDGLGVAGGGLGPMLDDTAKRAYRARIADLQDEIDEATTFNDPERAARAREELDHLTSQLSAAVGLGGRDRPTSSDAERARVAVTRSIRRAIDKLSEVHPDLATHLDQAVTTGTFCRYTPAAELEWTL